MPLASLGLCPPVFLAPMAGITDLPFRRVVAGFGAGLVVSEMIASEDMVHARPLANARAALQEQDLVGPERAPGPVQDEVALPALQFSELGLNEAASAVQLAGRDPVMMARAARFLQDKGARLIDINMGCPAKRVTASGGNGACGSALMKEPELALRLIEAVVGAVSVPVTLKTRLGWDETACNAPQIARMAEGAGISMITVHGRTRCQFYKGKADWAAIAAVKDAVRIPVIANGDIRCPQTAAMALRLSGADGVMVGRGAQGRPWLLAQIAHALYGAPAPQVPKGQALARLVIAHYQAALDFYGPALGRRVVRKHLGWYLDAHFADAGQPSFDGQSALRAAILTDEDPKRVIGLLERAFEQCDPLAGAA